MYYVLFKFMHFVPYTTFNIYREIDQINDFAMITYVWIIL